MNEIRVIEFIYLFYLHKRTIYFKKMLIKYWFFELILRNEISIHKFNATYNGKSEKHYFISVGISNDLVYDELFKYFLPKPTKEYISLKEIVYLLSQINRTFILVKEQYLIFRHIENELLKLNLITRNRFFLSKDGKFRLSKKGIVFIDNIRKNYQKRALHDIILNEIVLFKSNRDFLQSNEFVSFNKKFQEYYEHNFQAKTAIHYIGDLDFPKKNE
jgi:hypothetical protein